MSCKISERQFPLSIAMLALVFLVFGNDAHSYSAQEFSDNCRDAYKSTEGETAEDAVSRALVAGSCAGYVGGVINGINLVGNMLGQQKAVDKNFICLPEKKQSQALVYEVLEYIDQHPTLANSPVQLSIYNAFSKLYPCSPSDSDTK